MANATTLKALQDNATGELIPAFRDVTVIQQCRDFCLIDLGDHQPRRVERRYIKLLSFSHGGTAARKAA